MSVRFPPTWRVEPGAHYWRVRRRERMWLSDRIAVLAVRAARLRHRMRRYAQG